MGAAVVLYFHGFASSPASRKVAPLRELLSDVELVVPDMNVPSFAKLDWTAMSHRAVEHARRVAPSVIVGSSLGALLTLEVAAAGAPAPIVMIAPALGVARRWTEVLPHTDPVFVANHVTDRDEPIHRRFFEQMSELGIDQAPPPVPVTVVMGRQDESVPFEIARETWESWERSGNLHPASKFLEIPEGDHGLVAHVDTIAREIRERLRS